MPKTSNDEKARYIDIQIIQIKLFTESNSNKIVNIKKAAEAAFFMQIKI